MISVLSCNHFCQDYVKYVKHKLVIFFHFTDVRKKNKAISFNKCKANSGTIKCCTDVSCSQINVYTCPGTFRLCRGVDSHVARREFLLRQDVGEDWIGACSTSTVTAGGSVHIFSHKHRPENSYSLFISYIILITLKYALVLFFRQLVYHRVLKKTDVLNRFHQRASN